MWKKQLAMPVDAEQIICIQKGLSTRSIVKLMNEADLMKPAWLYEYYVKYLSHSEGKYLNAGCHHIPKGISHLELVDGLCSGKFTAQRQLTFPEGLSYKEISEIASERTNIPYSKFIALCENQQYLKSRGVDAKNAEGYLLPETYKFDFNITAEMIIDRLISASQEIWTQENINKAKAMGLTKHQILTLASIIEAETPVADEYPRVAGAYHNRLRIGMALQADPTVQYALGSKAKLMKEDMTIDSPYNTYVYAGLPPGPINNPGKKAILATLNPEKHDYLYFVAVGDGSGLHNFATDFDGHQKNINTYRKNRRK